MERIRLDVLQVFNRYNGQVICLSPCIKCSQTEGEFSTVTVEFPRHDMQYPSDVGWADPVVQGIWSDLDQLFQTWTPLPGTPLPVTGVYWEISPHIRLHPPIVLSHGADCYPEELSAEENLDLEYRGQVLMDWFIDSTPDADMFYPEVE